MDWREKMQDVVITLVNAFPSIRVEASYINSEGKAEVMVKSMFHTASDEFCIIRGNFGHDEFPLELSTKLRARMACALHD